MERGILLSIVKRDPERCLIEATTDHTVAFQGDAVDAPILCCGHCEADLVVAVDRRRLTNMIIECKQCGRFNDTREPHTDYSD
jgi:Trk K+ transport system NAD-binding subunit